MKNLNIALVSTLYDFQSTLIYNLFKKLSKKKISITQPHNADLIIYGDYNWKDPLKTFNIYELLKRKFRGSEKILGFIKKYEMKLVNRSFFKRNYKPISLRVITEFINDDLFNTDFVISHHLGIKSEKYLYYNNFKDFHNYLQMNSFGVVTSVL